VSDERGGGRRRWRGHQPRSRAGRLVVRLLNWLVYATFMALLGGWALMLAVGVVHTQWLRQVPTIGFWPAAAVVFLLGVVVTAVRPSPYAYQRLLDDEAATGDGYRPGPAVTAAAPPSGEPART